MVLLRLHGVQQTGNLHASRDAHKRENEDGNQEEDGQQAEIIELHRGICVGSKTTAASISCGFGTTGNDRSV